MRKPTFLFIGPDKTGSSWLYEIFRDHPNCFVPDCKDLYFFDRYYDRGIGWYLDFFAIDDPEVIALGELSHDYLFSPTAAERIAADLPGIQLLTSLRNPVERTFSHYLYMIRSGRTRLPFGQALDAFPELIHNSLYHRHLSAYFARFDREAIGVLFFDDLQASPETFARKAFDFLGVPFVESIDYGRRVLPASRPRNMALARLAKTGANLARDLRLTTLTGRVKRSRLAALLYRPYDASSRPRLAPEDRHRLVTQFKPDLRALEDLLRVPLRHWYDEPAGRPN